MQFFQKQLPGRAEKDPDGLMNLAYSMKINPKRMKKLEKDYTVLKMKEQEEMIELRRLRAENRLLRQRTELLEAESAELADRLVRGQVSRAEEEETAFVVQRELAALRHTHLETSHQLEQAHEELRSLSLLLEENVTSKQSSLDEILLKQEALSQKEEMIQCLQEELVKVRLYEAENEATIRELRARIQELEEDKKTLRETTPDNSVAHLQEELIAVKLREAEANLSLKVIFFFLEIHTFSTFKKYHLKFSILFSILYIFLKYIYVYHNVRNLLGSSAKSNGIKQCLAKAFARTSFRPNATRK